MTVPPLAAPPNTHIIRNTMPPCCSSKHRPPNNHLPTHRASTLFRLTVAYRLVTTCSIHAAHHAPSVAQLDRPWLHSRPNPGPNPHITYTQVLLHERLGIPLKELAYVAANSRTDAPRACRLPSQLSAAEAERLRRIMPVTSRLYQYFERIFFDAWADGPVAIRAQKLSMLRLASETLSTVLAPLRHGNLGIEPFMQVLLVPPHLQGDPIHVAGTPVASVEGLRFSRLKSGVLALPALPVHRRALPAEWGRASWWSMQMVPAVACVLAAVMLMTLRNLSWSACPRRLPVPLSAQGSTRRSHSSRDSNTI